jgi:hypothetical protein
MSDIDRGIKKYLPDKDGRSLTGDRALGVGLAIRDRHHFFHQAAQRGFRGIVRRLVDENRE